MRSIRRILCGKPSHSYQVLKRNAKSDNFYKKTRSNSMEKITLKLMEQPCLNLCVKSITKMHDNKDRAVAFTL